MQQACEIEEPARLFAQLPSKVGLALGLKGRMEVDVAMSERSAKG